MFLSALLTFTLACLQIQYPAYAITSSEETKPAKNVVTTQIIQEEDSSLDKPESVDQVKATETQETRAIIPQTTTQNETEPLIEPDYAFYRRNCNLYFRMAFRRCGNRTDDDI